MSNPLPTKTRISLTQLVCLSTLVKMPLKDHTKRQVSNKVHGLYKEVVSWVINQLQKTSRGRGKILLLLANLTPTNENRNIM